VYDKVRAIDWVDNVWPASLRAQQVSQTNDMDSMKYPKVRKYEHAILLFFT
jgi:hypothetical protein